jgi:hypothetical protein
MHYRSILTSKAQYFMLLIRTVIGDNSTACMRIRTSNIAIVVRRHGLYAASPSTKVSATYMLNLQKACMRSARGIVARWNRSFETHGGSIDFNHSFIFSLCCSESYGRRHGFFLILYIYYLGFKIHTFCFNRRSYNRHQNHSREQD